MEDILKGMEVMSITSNEFKDLSYNDIIEELEKIKSLVTPEWIETHPRKVANGREYYSLNSDDYDFLGIKLGKIILTDL